MLELESPFFADRWLNIMLRPYSQDQLLMVIRDITLTHRLDSIRKDFIANVSHELRTPLTVFHGYLEILQDMPSIQPDQLQEILAQMAGQSQRMQSLVKDLLLLSRLESAEPDINKHSKIHVATMLEAICSDAKVLSGDKAHQFSFELDDSLYIFGQEEELYSAFSNLVFNAVRYTPEKGTIFLKWYVEDEKSVLLIEDNGVCIAKEDIPKLTQRFYRTDKARSRVQDGEGTGLGLAIVKHVLLRHQAELYIESALGQGSRFYCFFY